MIDKEIFEKYEIEAVLAHFDLINQFNDLHTTLYELLAKDFGEDENADFFNNNISELKSIAQTINQAITQVFNMVRNDYHPYVHKDNTGAETDKVLGVIVYYMMIYSNVINHLKCHVDEKTYSKIYLENEETLKEITKELEDIDSKLDKILDRYI